MSSYAVIEYNVGDGQWRHGRSIESWVARDKAALSDQRKFVRENVREWGEALDETPVRTRVVIHQDE